MPNQRDIAKECGVSVMTVSLALRESPLISDATRNRVKEAADRLGYRPDPLVSALMANRRRNRTGQTHSEIALVSPLNQTEAADTGFLGRFMNGADERAERLGYSLEHFQLNKDGMDDKRLDEVLKARGIRAILLMPYPIERLRLELDWSHYVSAYIGMQMEWPTLHQVENDQNEMMIQALRRLEAKGYKRIGLAMSGEPDSDFAPKKWTMAYLAWQRQHGLSGELPIQEGTNNEEWNKDTFLAWYEKYKPDVVIGRDSYPLDWLREAGVKVPEDCGFVCMNLPEQEDTVAGMSQHFERVGQVAIDFLESELHANRFGIPEIPLRVLALADWQEGETIR